VRNCSLCEQREPEKLWAILRIEWAAVVKSLGDFHWGGLFVARLSFSSQKRAHKKCHPNQQAKAVH
ncbi:MAG: hypothetical protein K2K83_00815, partial [Rikenella sp.]|nr:hypothetical protein [Rikenella sp.]